MKATRRDADLPAYGGQVELLRDASYRSFMVARLEMAKARATRFCAGFPGTTAYAVKCNPHPAILGALADAGIRAFDVASVEEASLVRKVVPDAELIATHPLFVEIKTAYSEYGIRIFVIDGAQQLRRLDEAIGPGGEVLVLVRVATPTAAGYNLSAKFGAPAEVAAELLRVAHARGYRTGLAFHAGSQLTTPREYDRCFGLVAEAARASGVPIECLDVGGGFPGHYVGAEVPPLEAYLDAIRGGVARHDEFRGARLIAEPGRGLVADAMNLLTPVLAVRDGQAFIGDGRWGALSEAVTGNIRWPLRVWLSERERMTSATQDFRILGGTCDCEDHLADHAYPLPATIAAGDWLEFRNCGAYSLALATRFNGIGPARVVRVTGGETPVEGPLPELTVRCFSEEAGGSP